MNIHKEIADAVLNEPEYLFTVTYKQWGFIKRSKPVYLKGATASTLLKVAGLIEALKSQSDKAGESAQVFDLIGSNIDLLVDLIATVIHNDRTPVPSYLKDAILHDFEIEELKSLAHRVYRRLGVEPFFGIMELVHEFRIIAPPSTRQAPKAHGA